MAHCCAAGVGEQVDEDPFLLFVLRGRAKDEIVESLRALRADSIADVSGKPTATPESVPALADLLATFYQAGDELQRLTPSIAAPEIDSPLLRRLGAPRRARILISKRYTRR